jgi:hypothetical protein
VICFVCDGAGWTREYGHTVEHACKNCQGLGKLERQARLLTPEQIKNAVPVRMEGLRLRIDAGLLTDLTYTALVATQMNEKVINLLQDPEALERALQTLRRTATR